MKSFETYHRKSKLYRKPLIFFLQKSINRFLGISWRNLNLSLTRLKLKKIGINFAKAKAKILKNVAHN